jgi:hypothetical protein
MTCTTIGCTANGGVGGNYGGGGGAGNGPGTGSDVGGNGKQGVIVITYALEDNPFTPVRTLRLFEGFSIKFFSGKIIVYPQ